MSDDRYELGRDRLKQFFGDIADELPDETEKDDRLFELDNPGGVNIDVGINVATWDGAVEIQTFGETDVSVRGPYRYADDTETHIRISGVVDDHEHDTAASDVSLTFTREDAGKLAMVLAELYYELPETILDGADADGDSA